MLNNNAIVKVLSHGASDTKNFVFSPASAAFVLSMLKYASPKNSAHLDELGDFSGDTINRLWNLSLKFTNGVWSSRDTSAAYREEQGYDFSEVLGSVFKTELQKLDFGDTEAAAQIINKCADEWTDHMITDLVSAQELERALVVFMNTALLKAEWLSAFDPKQNVDAPFHTPSGDVNATFMRAESKMYYKNTETYQTVMLRLKGDRFFQIILPNKRYSVGEVVAKMDLSSISDGLNEVKVKLSFPKAKLASDLNLGEILGIGTASLDAFGALGDFPLLLKQKCSGEWDETGVRMAAATVAVVTRSIDETVTVNVDRPFIFRFEEPRKVLGVARPQDIGTFWGIVNNPVAEK